MYGAFSYAGFPYGGVGSSSIDPPVPGFSTSRLVPAAAASSIVLGASFTDTAVVSAAATDGRDERAGA